MVGAYEIAMRFHSSTCPYLIAIAIKIGTRNAETGQLMQTLNGHTSGVNSVAFSSDDLKIVSGSSDKSIKIWNAETGQLLQTLNGHTGSVNSVVFSTDNLKIVSGSKSLENRCAIHQLNLPIRDKVMTIVSKYGILKLANYHRL